MTRNMTLRYPCLTLAAGVLMLAGSMAHAQFSSGDREISGSLCVGVDCVNGESFGFDTIRLKENNLRIKFQDTSSTASFPSNDWQLTANDSSNGGANKFSIDDISGGRTPFTVEAGAPSNSLYVDDGGRIGFGTSTPVTELHVKDGDTPTLRLEQDGSSGFTAQTWDVAGNETNFFIRDATSGSTLPFRIRPGAPSNSIYVDTDGDIGMGTASPSSDADGEGTSAAVHISESDGNGALVVEQTSGTVANRSLLILKNNGRPRILFQNTASTNPGPLWSLSGGPTIAFRDRTAGVNVMEIAETTGNVTIAGTLTTGSSTVYPDYVFEPDYELMPLREVEKFIIENGHLPKIPTAEEVARTGLNITEMQVALLEKVEELTLYTLEQQSTIDTLRQRLEALED